MGFLEDRDLENVPGIPEYYKGKSIFITGGTGFIGKILIEKLLYSCTNLDKIYLLLRPKRGENAAERLKKLYDWQCFDRLRTERPGVFESKVVAIAGDILDEKLGISQADRKTLMKNVDVVFHVAASVRFDDHLSHAVRLNLKGTLEIIELAKEMKKLSALVHVSTSYSNTNRNPIEEVMYPPHVNWRDLLEVSKNVDYDTLDILTTKYLGDMPNTYTFTKQLAEHAVYEQQGVLPAVIVRPSIVVTSISEPMPGWIDNFNGPVALFVGYSKGIMKSVYARGDLTSDYIPVDICVKNLITTAWIRGTKEFESTDPVPVYNCCANDQLRVTLQSIVDNATVIAQEYPVNDMIWNHGMTITTSWTLHYILVILKHLLPAIFIDSLLWLMGKKPLLVKIQRRIFRAGIAVSYFSTRNWIFDNTNYLALRECIKTKDLDNFDYDIKDLVVEDYYVACCLGGKKFLLKESEDSLPRARRQFKIMWWLDNIVTVLFYAYIAWRLYNYILTTYINN